MKALLFLILFFPSVILASPEDFSLWLENFENEALAKGISAEIFEEALGNIKLNERVIELDKKQPEFTMSFSQYLEKVVSETRIKQGREMYRKNSELLKNIADKYGVPANYIVALWGIETSYGKITGGFNLPEALATLAFEGRRAEFFKKELLNALQILEEKHIEPGKMIGSWAGAMGQVQFMPSSFLAYAEDGDNDGKKDIWTNVNDALSSAANYLKQSGWNKEYRWGREVFLPDKEIEEAKKPLKEWQELGVKTKFGMELPVADINAKLIKKDDKSFLVYDNYDVIKKWNRSDYFALSVGLLADEIIK